MKPLLPLLLGTLGLAAATAAPNIPWTIGPDRVVQEDTEARAYDGGTLVSTYSGSPKTWKLNTDLGALPRFKAPGSPLVEALWNLSLEEVLKNQVTDGIHAGALSAGALWPGVWTRDASYAAHLSLAWLFPDAVKASLRAKVSLGRIVQDTGTGGSWPVSTDRVVWALAARELELITGDPAWAAEAYPILVRSAEADRAVALDPVTGLYNGETSFMDWREQSYPAWFQPADIFQSPATGTNALHRALYSTLEEWSPLLGRPVSETQTWHDRGTALTAAIDEILRLPNSTYTIYRYPRTAGGLLSNRTDTLGNALAVLTGIAPSPETVMANLPLEAYGPPVLYPQLAHTGPYHNKSVWPFVTAYYGWAAHKAGLPGASAFALETNLRAGALLLTNKENLVHDTGDPKGTSVNSDRQLWSAAGQLSGILRTLLGLDINAEGLAVAPVVPNWVKGPLSLSGLPWRGRFINLSVTGTGTKILTLKADGKSLDPSRRIAPDTLPGPSATLTLELVMAGDPVPAPPALADPTAKGPWDATSLTLTAAADKPRILSWKTRTGVAKSLILADGLPVGETKGNTFVLPPALGPLTVWSVTTVNEAGVAATRAEPVVEAPKRVVLTFADKDLGESLGDTRAFSLDVPTSGRWLVRFHYTNTSGPVATDNKAAVRTVSVDQGPAVGALVFPQRGYVSSNRGWSSSLTLDLTAGAHTLVLTFAPEDVNMDGLVNRAVVDGLEALPLD